VKLLKRVIVVIVSVGVGLPDLPALAADESAAPPEPAAIDASKVLQEQQSANQAGNAKNAGPLPSYMWEVPDDNGFKYQQEHGVKVQYYGRGGRSTSSNVGAVSGGVIVGLSLVGVFVATVAPAPEGWHLGVSNVARSDIYKVSFLGLGIGAFLLVMGIYGARAK
jgi:hypothetical protein